MKVNAFLVFACLATPATAIAQVSINVAEPASNVAEPTRGSNQVSPVTVSATESSPNGPSGWTVYVDNVLVLQNTNTSGRLNSTFPASPGTHNVVIKAWDNSGSNASASRTINVAASPLQTPPGNAVAFLGLQRPTGFASPWTSCDDPGCSGSDPGSNGTSKFSFDLSNPNLSGASMGLVSTNTTQGTYHNTLGYRHLGCPSGGCAARTNFLEDMWFYLPASDAALQATEYDPGVFVNNYKFVASMQCDSATKRWRFWNPQAAPGKQWTPLDHNGGPIPTYDCSILSQKDIWHHYQLYVTMNFAANTVTYQSFVVDGAIVYQNIGNVYGASSFPGTATINIQQQIDNAPVNTTPLTNVEYLDNYNLWAW